MVSLCEDCVISNTCDEADEEMTECNAYRVSYFERYCLNCSHWKILSHNNQESRVEPHCGLYSCGCATDITDHKLPRHYLHRSMV